MSVINDIWEDPFEGIEIQGIYIMYKQPGCRSIRSLDHVKSEVMKIADLPDISWVDVAKICLAEESIIDIVSEFFNAKQEEYNNKHKTDPRAGSWSQAECATFIATKIMEKVINGDSFLKK